MSRPNPFTSHDIIPTVYDVAGAVQVVQYLTDPSISAVITENFPPNIVDDTANDARRWMLEIIRERTPKAETPEPTAEQLRRHQAIIMSRGPNDVAIIPDCQVAGETIYGPEILQATSVVDLAAEPELNEGHDLPAFDAEATLVMLTAVRAAASTRGLQIGASDYLGKYSPDPVERIVHRFSRAVGVGALRLYRHYAYIGKHRAEGSPPVQQ